MFNSSKQFYFITLLVVCFVIAVESAKKTDENEKPAWAKKKITDYSDADLERLLDQWNVSYRFILQTITIRSKYL